MIRLYLAYQVYRAWLEWAISRCLRQPRRVARTRYQDSDRLALELELVGKEHNPYQVRMRFGEVDPDPLARVETGSTLEKIVDQCDTQIENDRCDQVPMIVHHHHQCHNPHKVLRRVTAHPLEVGMVSHHMEVHHRHPPNSLHSHLRIMVRHPRLEVCHLSLARDRLFLLRNSHLRPDKATTTHHHHKADSERLPLVLLRDMVEHHYRLGMDRIIINMGASIVSCQSNIVSLVALHDFT
jgi:hypothetical protein